MKRSQYWTVKQTHSKSAYNDEDEYAIINGDGIVIISVYGGRHETLLKIADAHNQCFFELAENEEARDE